MSDASGYVLKRQRALADFGEFALRSDDLDAVLTEACRLVGEALETGRAKVLEIEEEGRSLLVRAGVGWAPGVVGRVRLSLEERFPATRAVELGGPVIVNDASREDRFDLPGFLKEAGVEALANVPVFLPGGRLFGLLEVDADEPRAFGEDDVQFLRTYATILGPVIDRLRKMQALNASEERARRIVEGVKDHAIFTTDTEGVVVDWTPGAEAVFGWPADEIAGRSGDVLFTPEDRASGAPVRELATARREGCAADERWHVRRDGSRFFASGSVRPLHGAGGEVTGFIKIARDETERRAAEASLRASEAHLRELNADLERQVVERTLARGRTWQISPEIMGVINADGYFEQSNPAWEVVLGWSEAEVAGTVFLDFIHPNDLAKTQTAWADAMERGEPALRFENRYRRKDGSWRWLSWVAVPDDGKVYCSARDVTAEKEREAEFVERTAERDRMWDTSPDLMLVIDFAGVFRRVNPAWTAILGYAPEELVGHHVNEFVVLEDHDGTVDAYELAAHGGRPRIENRYRHKDGGVRWIAWTAAPAGDMTYATGRDVTSEKERAAELAAAQEALRQSQKMEAVGQLTGGLAHDFNNILAGISGSLELMGSRLDQGRVSEVERYMLAAQGAAKRAAALTHRLLAFSRRQTLEPKATDVNRLVAGMEELIRRTVGPAIEVEAAAAADLWPTLVDPNQLENALLNLCINARDAMPEGGKLTIETNNSRIDQRVARVRDLPAGEYVSLCVSDDGAGMPPQVAERAFDPFFTTKPIGQGTGLGLSMIYGFVRQSGGQARIHSELGRGTTVCLYLPRHHGEERADPPKPPEEAKPADAGGTVLVIDDEPLVRMVVVDVLEELGHVAIEADDGPQGLKVLRSDPRVDLLITDVGLPGGMNGRQVADAAREVRPDLKVLFITGYAENAVLNHGHLEPGMQVVTKPFDMQRLTSRIREMVAGGRQRAP